ncbi:gas vesicle protein K [Paraburkholderia sp. A1RI_3L]|uniref:gas vesicle protein K n=1 Tax=Paraburkholderia TaxID=1822464 RepID=UPI003B811F03
MTGPFTEQHSAAAVLAAALEQALAKERIDPSRPRRFDVSSGPGCNGLAQLVLTVVKLLHELLERQALRRIEAGGLNDDEIERLGLTFMRQTEEIDRIAAQFGLDPADLNLDLGPLGRLF